MSYVADLDTPLLRLSPTDHFTLRDAVAGVHVFGGTGSGKTSGSGRALASAYLRAGMGGLVLCAKPDEVELWQRYAAENGRSESVLLFGERGGGFNFIAYELSRQGFDGLGSVVECLMRILDAARRAAGAPSAANEAFWDDAMRQVLRNSVPILYSALGRIEIPDIIRFVAEAPKGVADVESAEWQGRSFMFQALLAARRSPRHAIPTADYDKIAAYWRYEFAPLSDKLRSSIAMTLSTALDRFNRGRLQRAFCGDTTLVPELTFHGAIIILDMPALTWNEDGIVGQQLFKFMWQRAVLARNALEPRHRDRPVFCWADESQYFVNGFDSDFQSACRSSRACSVYLTQSLPTYYARLGGAQPKHAADMLLANFVTKVFHNNADPETNRWAADTIGRSLQRRANHSDGSTSGMSMGMNRGGGTSWGSSHGSSVSGSNHGTQTGGHNSSNKGGNTSWGQQRGRNTGESVSDGYSETMDYEVEPGDFSRYLHTGGAASGGVVTGFWFQAGRRFAASGRNYLYAEFLQ